MPATPTRRAALVPAVLAAAFALGCGSKSAPAPSDPAAVVPARAPAYVEIAVPPEGAARDGEAAAVRTLLGTPDPRARLERVVGPGDVGAWIGDRLAAFALGATTGQAAVVASVADTGAARDWVAARGARTERRRDIELRLAGGRAYAVVADRVVAGTPAAVRAAVDAAAGDDLASSEAFRSALDRVGGGGDLGRAYLAPRDLVDGVTGSGAGGGLPGSLAVGVLTDGLPTAVAMRLTGEASAIGADVAAVGGARSAGTPDPAFVAGLTGRAWLASGLGDVGRRLTSQLGASGAILGLLGAPAGLDIQRDLLDWMGEGAVFLTGRSPDALGGALVVRSKDPAATRAAIPRLAALVARFATGSSTSTLRASGVDAGVTVRAQGVPAPVEIAAAGDRFVVALGRAALREAVSPTSRLGDDPDFRAAAATLGGGLRPTTFVGARAVTPLAAAVARNAGADARQVRALLARITALVAADRGDARWRASLGLR